MGIRGVRHLPCGEFVNASERLALERLRVRLENAGGDWILLSNLNHSQHPTIRSDEIDLVVIGASGVYVIEVKHWDANFLRQQASKAEIEAERINAKAKRIAGKLRKRFEPGFVTPRLLLTRGDSKFESDKRPQLRGVSVFGLPEWSELLGLGGASQLGPEQIELAARLLEPAAKLALSGELRAFAGLINLERISDRADAFHRAYRGQHPTRRDRVILHLYDLSASQDKQALDLARREFDAIQRWQKSPYVPSLLDSFQEVEGYPGELYFFSLVDPGAPTVRERAKDPAWDIEGRIEFARSAVSALAQFHNPNEEGLTPLLHRRITPETLRVRHNGLPLFTDFAITRLQDAQTVCTAEVDFGSMVSFVAPEVRQGGLAAADVRSDVFSLCATLLSLFEHEGAEIGSVWEILSRGCVEDPEARADLVVLAHELAQFSPAAIPTPRLPAPEYWDEDTIVPFQQSRYKIVSRLGKGGIGQTFKVVELDIHSDEKFGTYVAKIVDHEDDGTAALKAYRKVRAYTTHEHLSAIHEIAPVWDACSFVALLKWVEGVPLQDLVGVLPIYAEDLGERSAEQLAIRWLIDLCGALGELHRVGLVHGDVSLKNIIVQGGRVFLTDYDTVTDTRSKPRGGTVLYSSPSVQNGLEIQPSDDVYALAASFFQVVADRVPFEYGAERRKDRGLNWERITGFDGLRGFLDLATHPRPEDRFKDALAARQYLEALSAATGKRESSVQSIPDSLTPNTVPWLRSLLSAYPGSRHGNRETRGLDSDFALATYVNTRLDEALLEEIRAAKVNLVILFGNAGDGKTAFLQHLGKRLGVRNIDSSQRLWEADLEQGRRLKVNLDGSAAWQGRSANALIDEILRPFHSADYSRKRVHIVAINSGKLLEWIESQPTETYLTEQLRRVLVGDPVTPDQGFRFIDLNQRSLVGGIDLGSHKLTTHFVDSLLDRFLGGGHDPWQACLTCTAQNRCTAWHSVRMLRDPDSGQLLRRRLRDSLQACHQRGEVHITARELRAAVSYIFFGVHDCSELHEDPDLRPQRYWNRAFDAASIQRQGELLAELARFDPALEADSVMDRFMLKEVSGLRVAGTLEDGRRRAWFERPDVKGEPQIGLAGGRHHPRFRDVPSMDESERRKLLKHLCSGIARLEDLPQVAFANRDDSVPLRISPRTPTESAFWVRKPLDRFRLEAPLPPKAEGLEALHTHLRIVYRYLSGDEETLELGLELFHLLLELKDGVQLYGVAQEGVFANLEIFTQRLAREDARELVGWHPAEEDAVFRIRVEARGDTQVLVREGA